MSPKSRSAETFGISYHSLPRTLGTSQEPFKKQQKYDNILLMEHFKEKYIFYFILISDIVIGIIHIRFQLLPEGGSILLICAPTSDAVEDVNDASAAAGTSTVYPFVYLTLADNVTWYLYSCR